MHTTMCVHAIAYMAFASDNDDGASQQPMDTRKVGGIGEKEKKNNKQEKTACVVKLSAALMY